MKYRDYEEEYRRFDEEDFIENSTEDSVEEYADDPYEQYLSKKQARREKIRRRKKRLYRRLGIFIFLLFCLFVMLLFITGYWKTLVAKLGAAFVSSNMNEFQEEELSHSFSVPEKIPEGFAYDSNVVNILLVGIEGIGSSDAYGGRSDSMMLCSYRLDTGEIRLVSLLRDTYVAIEGHGNKKLNAAYAYGKLDLLIPTIQNTYKIFIDGVARVNFEEFEEVIDLLGGVDIELTEKEAEYLRTTNYISDPNNRNVVAGWNHLNGNQALGYCRVRKVATMDGDASVNNDYGRTLRQRKVLSAIFESYKNCSKTELYSVTKKILSVITSSLTEKQLAYCIESYLKNPADSVISLQMPAKGYYRGEVIEGVGDCIVPDYEANVAILHYHLYGVPLPEGITLQ